MGTGAAGAGRGAAQGASYGATAGAAVGSVIPVVGTAIGGAVGAGLGAIGGALGGGIRARRQRKKQKKAAAAAAKSEGKYFGGSHEASARLQNQWQGGIASGRKTVQQGLGAYSKAAHMGTWLAETGAGLSKGGQQLMTSGLTSQAAAREQQLQALGLQRAAAMGQAPSQAQALAAAAQDAQARQMMAMAASARGGNQAAAMRAAQAQSAQDALLTGQSNAALRAQEMAEARAGYSGMALGMRGQDLGVSQMGLSQTGMGLGAHAQGAGAVQAAAQGITAAGLSGEQSYLSALTGQIGQEQAARAGINLEAMRIAEDRRKAQRAETAGYIATAGNVLGKAAESYGQAANNWSAYG